MYRLFLSTFLLTILVSTQAHGFIHSHSKEETQNKTHTPYNCSICEYQSHIKGPIAPTFHLNRITFLKKPIPKKVQPIINLYLLSNSAPRAPPVS